MSMKNLRLTPSVIAVVVVAVLVGGGSATAGSLITSKQIKNGTIQKSDLSKKAIKSLSGKSGPAGPAGTQGPAGTPATSLWAVVQATDPAVVVRGSGVTGVNNPGTGSTRVSFDRDITDCSYQVTAGATGDDAAEEAIVTAEQENSATLPNVLRIRYRNLAGTLANSSAGHGYHVSVFC